MKAILVIGVVLMAGCASKPANDRPPITDGSGYMSGINLIPLSANDVLVEVSTGQSQGTLVAREPDGEWKSTPMEIFFRVFDPSGAHEDHIVQVPGIGPGTMTEYTFAYPAKPGPFVITGECKCMVWVKNLERDPRIRLVPLSLVKNETRLVTVQYDPLGSSRGILKDDVAINFNASTVHWVYFRETNARATVRFTSPSGREVGKWQVEGRDVTGGHVSNGSRPLEIGDWHLSLEGTGWFTMRLDRFYLDPETWTSLGFKPPA